MFNIIRGSKTRPQYLSYDDTGQHIWTDERLDAIRFNTAEEANQCCGHYTGIGAKIVGADPWDGHYETYKDHEIQIFRDDLKSKPGGKRWRYRFGPIVTERAYEYAPSNIGYTSPGRTINAAKAAIDLRLSGKLQMV